jgi:two-component system nitrogen regulation response regulator NtrX
MIHPWSPRAQAPFIVVSAAMMSPDRVEEELFGSEVDGVARPGLLEQAHGGTLSSTRSRTCRSTTQAKILRVLTDQSYHRSAASGRQGRRPRAVGDRRAILRTRSPRDASARTLYYRLNVVRCAIPPLRERREDIPELANHSSRASPPSGDPAPNLSDEAMAALQAHDWPATSASCAIIIERTVILAPATAFAASRSTCCRRKSRQSGSVGLSSATLPIMGSPLREARESFEREYLKIQIRRFSGNISRTASFIGMERSALHRKLKALGIATSATETSEEAGRPRMPDKPLSLQDQFLNAVRVPSRRRWSFL